MTKIIVSAHARTGGVYAMVEMRLEKCYDKHLEAVVMATLWKMGFKQRDLADASGYRPSWAGQCVHRGFRAILRQNYVGQLIG